MRVLAASWWNTMMMATAGGRGSLSAWAGCKSRPVSGYRRGEHGQTITGVNLTSRRKMVQIHPASTETLPGGAS